jgi:hypothetical protein
MYDRQYEFQSNRATGFVTRWRGICTKTYDSDIVKQSEYTNKQITG